MQTEFQLIKPCFRWSDRDTFYIWDFWTVLLGWFQADNPIFYALDVSVLVYVEAMGGMVLYVTDTAFCSKQNSKFNIIILLIGLLLLNVRNNLIIRPREKKHAV